MLEATVKPALGMVQLKQIKSSDIQKLIAQKKADGYSHSTVVKVYQFFTALMEFAIGNRDLAHSPAQMVIMPEKNLFKTKEIRIFSDEEVEKIVAAARELIVTTSLFINTVSHLHCHNSVKTTYDTYIHMIKGIDHDAVAVLDAD